MPSTVYFMDLRATFQENLTDKLTRLIETAGIEDVISTHDLTAVKLHFGELGNVAFIKPAFVRKVCEAVDKKKATPFLVDTNTLYKGTRSDTPSHIKTAIKNGFAYSVVGAPIVIADRKEPPEEENDPDWGKCPFLNAKSECSIYPVRPFACRCLVSTKDCAMESYAQIDEYTLTVNNVLIQYIEHVDHTGITGNLTDMLMLGLSSNTPNDSPNNIITDTFYDPAQQKAKDRFLQNSPIKLLLAPPEYQADIRKLLSRLEASVAL